MDFEPVLRLGLLLVRAGMVFGTAPVFGGTAAPTSLKIVLSVTMAMLMLPVVPIPGTVGPGELTLVIAREAAIGLALAMAVRVMVAGAELAGQLAGFQLGLSFAAIVDPQTGVRSNVLAMMYGMLALFTFFGVNGHHAMIRALARSYVELPVGPGGLDGSMTVLVSRMLGLIFLLGAQLAAPIVVVLIIVELALGLIVRAAPAMNLMVIGFPLRLLVGLTALAVAVQVVPLLVSRVAEPAFDLSLRTMLAFR